MPGKSEPSPFLGPTLVLVFLVLLGLFLDAAWVLGQKAWMHAFGERTQGWIVETHSYSKRDKRGRSYKVSVHDYQYQDASGAFHIGQTGHKSVLFSRERPPMAGITEPTERMPRVSVLYLRGTPSASWAVEAEPGWSDSFFLVGVLLLPLSISGLGAFATMRGDSGPDVARSRPAPRVPSPPAPVRVETFPAPGRRGKRQKKKQGGP